MPSFFVYFVLFCSTGWGSSIKCLTLFFPEKAIQIDVQNQLNNIETEYVEHLTAKWAHLSRQRIGDGSNHDSQSLEEVMDSDGPNKMVTIWRDVIKKVSKVEVLARKSAGNIHGPISGLISRKNGLYSYTFLKNGLVQKALLLTSKSEIEMLDDGDAKARLKDLHTSALEEIRSRMDKFESYKSRINEAWALPFVLKAKQAVFAKALRLDLEKNRYKNMVLQIPVGFHNSKLVFHTFSLHSFEQLRNQLQLAEARLDEITKGVGRYQDLTASVRLDQARLYQELLLVHEILHNEEMRCEYLCDLDLLDINKRLIDLLEHREDLLPAVKASRRFYYQNIYKDALVFAARGPRYEPEIESYNEALADLLKNRYVLVPEKSRPLLAFKPTQTNILGFTHWAWLSFLPDSFSRRYLMVPDRQIQFRPGRAMPIVEAVKLHSKVGVFRRILANMLDSTMYKRFVKYRLQFAMVLAVGTYFSQPEVFSQQYSSLAKIMTNLEIKVTDYRVKRSLVKTKNLDEFKIKAEQIFQNFTPDGDRAGNYQIPIETLMEALNERKDFEIKQRKFDRELKRVPEYINKIVWLHGMLEVALSESHFQMVDRLQLLLLQERQISLNAEDIDQVVDWIFNGKYNQPPQFKLQLSEAVLKVPITDLLAKTDSRFIDDVNQALESFNQRHSEAGIFGEQVLEGLYSIKTLREKYYEKYAQRLSDEKEDYKLEILKTEGEGVFQ